MMSEQTAHSTTETASDVHDLYGLTPELLHAILDSLSDDDANRLEALIVPLHVADIADLLEQITSHQRRQVLDALRSEFDPEVLAHLDESVLEDVVEILGTDDVAHMVEQLETDDAVDVLEDLDQEVQEEVLAAVPFASRRIVEEGLTFPEDSAGRLMRRDRRCRPDVLEHRSDHRLPEGKRRSAGRFLRGLHRRSPAQASGLGADQPDPAQPAR